MRLGGYFGAEGTEGLDLLCEQLDTHGLSAISAPGRLVTEGEPDACEGFGARARRLGIVVGEAGMWDNLLTRDEAAHTRQIATTRKMLRNADAMGCRCVVTLVGSRHPGGHPLAIHPDNYTDACKSEFREIVLRILDGLDLRHTKYVVEPWHNTFFYDPSDIRAFFESVNHPAFGLHLDQMNLVSQRTLCSTTDLINQTFDLLADRVVAAHLKDIRHDFNHMFLKLDEVYIGDGVMDYNTYLRRLAELPPDTPCFCEHFAEERDYALNFARLHRLAGKAGVRFLERKPAPPTR